MTAAWGKGKVQLRSGSRAAPARCPLAGRIVPASCSRSSPPLVRQRSRVRGGGTFGGAGEEGDGIAPWVHQGSQDPPQECRRCPSWGPQKASTLMRSFSLNFVHPPQEVLTQQGCSVSGPQWQGRPAVCRTRPAWGRARPPPAGAGQLLLAPAVPAAFGHPGRRPPVQHRRWGCPDGPAGWWRLRVSDVAILVHGFGQHQAETSWARSASVALPMVVFLSQVPV